MAVPAVWNFQNIQALTRQASGQLSAATFTNQDLQFQINAYYQFDLPRELKIEELYTQYTFPLYQGIAVYELPGFYGGSAGPFTHVEPRLFINGQPIFYTQDTDIFYSRLPLLFTQEIAGYGDGTTKAFTYTTLNMPIVPNMPASVMVFYSIPTMTAVSVQGETLSDDGNGNLISNYNNAVAGTVNYTSGALSFTFQNPAAPPAGATIYTSYQFQEEGFPNTVLFYQRQFTFFPTPDQGYQCRIDAYFQPPALINPTDQPVKPEWGEIIAMGAALKILRNFGQFDKYQELKVYYDKERSKVMSDTDNQLMATRSEVRF